MRRCTFIQARRGGWFKCGATSHPWRSALTRTGPAPYAERMLLTCRKSAGFRRSDEGNGAKGNRQHEDLDEGCTLFQAQLACDVLSQSWTMVWLSKAFGVGSRELSGVGRPRGSPVPENGLPPGLAHQRQVGIFGTNDASGVESWEPVRGSSF